MRARDMRSLLSVAAGVTPFRHSQFCMLPSRLVTDTDVWARLHTFNIVPVMFLQQQMGC